MYFSTQRKFRSKRLSANFYRTLNSDKIVTSLCEKIKNLLLTAQGENIVTLFCMRGIIYMNLLILQKEMHCILCRKMTKNPITVTSLFVSNFMTLCTYYFEMTYFFIFRLFCGIRWHLYCKKYLIEAPVENCPNTVWPSELCQLKLY